MNQPALDALPEETVDEVVARHPDRTGDILAVLEELQGLHPARYLPAVTLRQVARKTGLALSRVFAVATFYSFFNLEPQGRHSIMVCRGTACHTRGSRRLVFALRSAAGAPPDPDGALDASFTTPDRELTVRTVACFGQCALAPVIAADDQIHSHVTEPGLHEILARIRAAPAPGPDTP